MDSTAQVRVRSSQPCAACRMLRRRCASGCILAPYFPVEQSENFAHVHKVFGASNVIKMLQMVDRSKREDAVKSMVYEAKARLKDPIYGATGTIFHLQKHVKDLQTQLQLLNTQALQLQAQRDQLMKLLMDFNNNGNQASPVNDANFDSYDMLLGDQNGISADYREVLS